MIYLLSHFGGRNIYFNFSMLSMDGVNSAVHILDVCRCSPQMIAKHEQLFIAVQFMWYFYSKEQLGT